MRYKAGHKQATRERIVCCAARRFRGEGYESSSLAEVMGDAGLTVGGFYSHFGSKEELLAEAISVAGNEAIEDRTHIPERAGVAWLKAFLSRYLNEEHVLDRADGCPLAGLGSEVARLGDLPRQAYGGSASSFVEELAAHLEGDEPSRLRVARAVLSMCVGALTLARASGARSESQALFEACREAGEILAAHGAKFGAGPEA